MQNNVKAKGRVIYTLGNLIKVEFEDVISLGEVAFVKLTSGESLKAEVIEIEGRVAKLQVFEDTRGIKLGTLVEFADELLVVELGPGLLSEVFDGLQNPLEKIADASGLYLHRGVYIDALDRVKRWDFHPVGKIGSVFERGDELGYVPESQFRHKIMLPFSMYGKYTLTWIVKQGSYVVDEVIAKVKDEKGHEIELTMVQKWPVKAPLRAGEKIKAKKMLTTGVRVIDTMIPLVKGGSAANPGPFGAGKTVTQHSIAKFSNVDIVVFAACGERAGEVVEVLKTFPTLVDLHSKQPLMDRTVIICNTSSMPVAAREASVYVGVTISEYYRQMGLDVLLLADSTSRWAQAMREMSGRLEEIPGDEAFPAYLSSRISSFYERSGVIKMKNGEEGSVSILGAVSPAGGNMSEPVTQATMNVVGAFICLSREFSDKRRYPAIDTIKSWSKYIETVANEVQGDISEWGSWVLRARKLLVEGDEIGRRMEVVGQEGTSIDDVITYLKSELFSFCYLQQNAFEPEDAYCCMDQQKLQFKLMNRIFDMKFPFTNVDEAKSYFLKLQNEIKNLNYLKFQSDAYQGAMGLVERELNQLLKQEESVV